MRNKGVTLISLVVTIIVLLILAGITIGTIFNDNGIIKKAQEAANATEEAAKNDQAAINGLLNEMDSIINGIGGNIPVIGSINGKITWSTGSATLTLTTDVEGVTIQYRKNSESNWTNYTSAVPSLLHGDKVYARGIKGGETVINEKEFKIQDTIAPTVTIANASSTTNSISATATATDNEAGMGSSPQYTFYIKKTAEADSAYTQIGSSANTSVTKGGLEQNISYTIKVEVADVAGNKGQATKEITTGKIADAGEGLTNGAIIASSPVWSDGTASITLSTSSGLTIQYQKGGINGSWTTGTSVTGLHHRDTIFARLTDGKNYGGEASITILDTVIPQDARISLSGTSTTTAGNVTATVTLKDNESGVNATASKWTYNTNSGNIGTNESSYNNNFSSNGQTIQLKATTAGTYYLHVLTVDNAGNKVQQISEEIKIEKADIEYVTDGLIVYYDAINNTGNGHANNITTWKNLVSDKYNGIIHGGVWHEEYFQTDGIDDWVDVGLIKEPNITIESVVAHGDTYNSYGISNFDSGGIGLSDYNKSGYNGLMVYTNGYKTIDSSKRYTVNKIYSLSGSYNGRTAKFFENGDKYSLEVNAPISYASNTIYALGGNPSGTSCGMFTKEKIYSIRIYNRALTDEEVLQNYNMDKAIYNFLD